MSTTHRRESRSGGALVVLLGVAAGGLVAIALGVYGREHTPTGEAITTLGFPSLIAMKVWLASAAGALGLVQLVTALRLFGRLGPGSASRAIGMLHRFSGVVAVAVSLPVAYHCLWSLGFADYDNRVLAHSVTGCLFYGAFVTKLVSLHSRRAPGWLLPVAGGLVFTVLAVCVLSSAGWYFQSVGVPR